MICTTEFAIHIAYKCVCVPLCLWHYTTHTHSLLVRVVCRFRSFAILWFMAVKVELCDLICFVWARKMEFGCIIRWQLNEWERQIEMVTLPWMKFQLFPVCFLVWMNALYRVAYSHLCPSSFTFKSYKIEEIRKQPSLVVHNYKFRQPYLGLVMTMLCIFLEQISRFECRQENLPKS